MAAHSLTHEQQQKLLEWLAAGYPGPLIRQCFLSNGWKPITPQAIHYYRDQHREVIEERAALRMAAAFDAGLAQKEERIRALVHHAETLEELKWTPDDKGKLHNEKAWRETLDDIAKEMGHRRQGVDLNVSRLSDAELIAQAAGCLGGTGPPGPEAPDEP